jgi:MSHA biogenesis protein MshN
VLNDLEKRGASPSSLEQAVRPVPVQRKWPWQYAVAGVALVGVALAAGWMLRRPVIVLPPVVAVAPVVSGVVVASQVVASQPQAASQIAAVEPAEVKAPDAASYLNLKPSPKLLPPKVSPKKAPLKPLPPKPPAKLAEAAKPGSASPLPLPAVNKEMKIISPQQQAEREYYKAGLLTQQGRLKDAAEGYTAALQLYPAYDRARESLAAVLVANKLNADAEKVLEEGLALNPKQTHFAMLLARLQVERNALPAALQTLEKALPFADQQADYHAFMAALLQRQSRHAEAITHYQTALQLSPNSGVWLMGLGMSLQATQRKEDARYVYKRAIDSHSLSPELQAFVEQRLEAIK